MAGSVCPYCHRDKSADVAWTTASYVAVAVAALGYFVGGFLGAVVGFVVGWAAWSAISRRGKAKQPAAPRSPQPSQPAADDSVATKLAQLKQMHEQGLLTAEEYATKKADLLSRI